MYSDGAKVHITDPTGTAATGMTTEVPVTGRVPRDGQHEFVLHQDCWSLLQKTLQDSDTFRHRLLAICNSTPISFRLGCINWEHDYGGLVRHYEEISYPWEEEADGISVVQSVVENSPLNSYDISKFLNANDREASQAELKAHSEDMLTALPQEVMELIVSELPIGDVFNMRLVFPSLRPILNSTGFWISRFRPCNERGFVFEAREKNGLDWISLYRSSSSKNLPNRLANRKRVWLLILALSKLTKLRLAADPAHLPTTPADLTWIDVTGDVGKSGPFKGRCRPIGSHTVLIPPDLLSICVSVVAVGKVTYITGICLRSSTGENIRLGYFTSDVARECRIGPFQGFVLAVGPRGIHALRVVHGEMQQSEWVGNPEEVPITERLVTTQAVHGLRIIFDVSVPTAVYYR